MNAAPSAESIRFNEAIRRFDAVNARDPNQIEINGRKEPRELAMARCLDAWVRKLAPGASESLMLAARCQHIGRWEIPRDRYPRDRAGYLRWRADLRKFHAECSGAILREIGYPEEIIRRVQDLNLKKGLGSDPETQALEDALCLVFLEHQFAELASRTPDDRMINALRKSWQKMSSAARAEALKLRFSPNEQRLLALALNHAAAFPPSAPPTLE